uniref:nicotinate-nucleotide adenylyltransferase n=1 Tax=Vulcanococcus sp. TaxID=2856995 RepID=UPI0037DA234B
MNALPSLALLGTSADPPTEGHRALLEGLADHYGQVATWASDNPFKQHGAPLELRARLLGALVEAIGDPRIRHAQDLSSPRALITLERAAERWPGRSMVFVVGGDLAAQVPSWWKATELLQRCRLAVVPRQGFSLDPAALEAIRNLGGQPELLHLPVPATASSSIRRHPSPEQVPAALWEELVRHNLYG